MYSSGTASIQTLRQMPVVRVYQMPPLPRCLPLGCPNASSAGSKTSTTSSCSLPGARRPASKEKWAYPPSCSPSTPPSRYTRARQSTPPKRSSVRSFHSSGTRKERRYRMCSCTSPGVPMPDSGASNVNGTLISRHASSGSSCTSQLPSRLAHRSRANCGSGWSVKASARPAPGRSGLPRRACRPSSRAGRSRAAVSNRPRPTRGRRSTSAGAVPDQRIVPGPVRAARRLEDRVLGRVLARPEWRGTRRVADGVPGAAVDVPE